MSTSFDQRGSWDRVAAELRACKESQRRAYGDVDNATLGRYLSGDMTPDETAVLEQTLDELPELRKLADLVQGVLSDLEPVEEAPAAAPVILPLPAARPRRQYSSFRRYASLAVACLLFACLALLPATRHFSKPPADRIAARGEASHRDAAAAAGLADEIVWLDAPRGGEMGVARRPEREEDEDRALI